MRTPAISAIALLISLVGITPAHAEDVLYVNQRPEVNCDVMDDVFAAVTTYMPRYLNYKDRYATSKDKYVRYGMKKEIEDLDKRYAFDGGPAPVGLFNGDECKYALSDSANPFPRHRHTCWHLTFSNRQASADEMHRMVREVSDDLINCARGHDDWRLDSSFDAKIMARTSHESVTSADENHKRLVIAWAFGNRGPLLLDVQIRFFPDELIVVEQLGSFVPIRYRIELAYIE